MVTCAVEGCKNRSDGRRNQYVRFFRFPKDEKYIQLWLKVCSPSIRYGKNISNARICSAHFQQSDYEDNFYKPYLPDYSPTNNRHLLQHAVPSLNLNINRTNNQVRDLGHPTRLLENQRENMYLNGSISISRLPFTNLTNNINFSQTIRSVDLHQDSGKIYEDIVGNLPNQMHPGLYNNPDQNYAEQTIPAETFLAEQTSPAEQTLLTEQTTPAGPDTYAQQSTDAAGRDTSAEQSTPQISVDCTSNGFENDSSVNVDSYQQLQNENIALVKHIKKIKQESRKERAKLKQEIKQLRSKAYFQQKMEESLQHVFTPKQVDKLLHPNKKKMRWDIQTISSAMSFRAVSPKGHRFMLKKGFPFPSVSNLRKYSSYLYLTEGILTNVLDLMQIRGKTMQTHEKIVILSFDEVYLSKKIEIDGKVERVVGPHKTAQVGMVRGLFSNWKQPVYYKFDQSLSKNILEEIISSLWEVGYTVVGVVTDLGGNNGEAFKDYKIGCGDNETCFFKHPSCKHQKIFVFADTPHLIKLFRNHLLDTGFIYRNLTLEGEMEIKRVNKGIIEELLRLHNTCELKVAFKLNQEQIDVRGAKRQKVSTATKLISNTTAQALKWAGENGLLTSKDWPEAHEILKLMNDWFDLFNSKSPNDAYGKNLETQNVLLPKVITKMGLMKFETKKGNLKKALFPFQKGIIMNCMGLKQMLPYLQQRFGTDKFKITEFSLF